LGGTMSLSEACRTFVPLLSPFIDGELSSSERRAVEHHLEACQDCSARAADLRAQSGLVRIGLELLADEADFSNFANKVMARMTPSRIPFWERWKLSLSELFTYHRAAMVSSLVTAGVAAAIAIPLALRSGPPTGYASERMAVRKVSTVPEAHVAPVVMKGEHGNAIIWLVDHKHLLQSSDEQPGSDSAAQPGGAPEPDVKPPLNPQRPHGGEL
jgi:anti-sigma factor RsiW